MTTRREFLRHTAALALCMPLGRLAESQAQLTSFTGDNVLDRILKKAKDQNWAALPIGERVGKIAVEFLGTPYVDHTLELDDSKEFCTINLDGLDCVTFFEDALDLARTLRTRHPSREEFIRQIRFTRYRGGVQGDYTSRLHYTTDWIADNVKKGVVRDLTPSLPGAEPFTQQVGFMSENPGSYRQLKANPDLVPAIRTMEARVNNLKMLYVPIPRIADAEPLLLTGDIVGITTAQTGIDIAHTGLCYRDDEGLLHFLDASSNPKRMKVSMEGRLSESLHWSRRLTGIMIARPVEN